MSVAEAGFDRASEPEAFRRIIQRDANTAHARDLIGLRRDFANLTLAERSQNEELDEEPGCDF